VPKRHWLRHHAETGQASPLRPARNDVASGAALGAALLSLMQERLLALPAGEAIRDRVMAGSSAGHFGELPDPMVDAHLSIPVALSGAEADGAADLPTSSGVSMAGCGFPAGLCVSGEDTAAARLVARSSGDRLAFHRARATLRASIRAVCHHRASSGDRWSSRWCNRHKGTANSSLTLRPRADFWANRR
jgi:hypothetical protein